MNNSINLTKNVVFDVSHNYSSVCHSMLDKSYDTFCSSEKTFKQKSNPILESVIKAIPIIREPRCKLAENLHNMIMDVLKTKSGGAGKDAIVYDIPQHPDLVLRVERTALENKNKIANELELVPISFDEEIASNNHLGIPLYYVTSNTSTISKKISISPLEAMSQNNKIMVLKKVSGTHPADECGQKFLSLIGIHNNSVVDYDLLNNFSYTFGYIKENFGREATAKCLEYMKSGAKEIPAHALAEGSAPFEIVRGKEFYDKYMDFADSYVDFLGKVSVFPQKSFDDAVKLIASPKKFNMDFQHVNNTFVDFDKKEFNFVDFSYNKKDKKYVYGNPVKEFRNVLFGKFFKNLEPLKDGVSFLPNLRTPRTFIVYPEHMSKVKEYSRIINDKINLSAPEEFKSEKVFS